MRPQSITILCILLFVIGASLLLRSIGQFFLVPGYYSFFMLLISLLGLYGYYGLWIMKHWSIPVFILVWSAIFFPMVLGPVPFSRIMLLRYLYIAGVVAAFMIVVLPHRDKLSKGPIWDFRRSKG